MIAYLKGEIFEAHPGKIILLCGGVRYAINVPSSYHLETNDTIALKTHLQVREDAHVLFGFRTDEEKTLFLLLQKVSGVGPALSLAILGGSSAKSFKDSVASGDVTALSKIKGVGKKTAERIVFDLGDKLGVSDTWKDEAAGTITAAASDTELALVTLGYKKTDARKAVEEVTRKNPGNIQSSELLRLTLQFLNNK